MSILIDKSTRLLVQGITGRDGHFHAVKMKEYGTNVVGGMTAVPDEENDTVKLTLLGKTGTEIASVDIPGGTGGGGNTYNVTAEVPLESGYYVLSSAIGAVDEKYRYKGRCITYEVSQGKWETKQFVGTSLSSWEQEASWEDFGGAGTMKSLTVNGEKKVPDSEGNVDLTIDKLEVDESLDADSTNPVQNKTVAAKFQEVEAGTVFGMSAEVSDDESSVRLALTNKSGAEIASVDIPAGSGGGGESSTTKIVLLAETDKKTVKEGGAVKLTYTYDHQVAGGDDKGSSTGQKATVTIQVKRGTTTTYSSSLKEVSKGTYTLDLTKYLLVGTSDIYVIAETTDPTTGKAQKKQAYVTGYKLVEETRKRLEIMVRTNDGFEIAEADLKLRGPGDLEGTQQSGIAFDLKIADIARDGQLLQYVRNVAEEVVDADPTGIRPENEILWRQLKALRKTNVNWASIS